MDSEGEGVEGQGSSAKLVFDLESNHQKGEAKTKKIIISLQNVDDDVLPNEYLHREKGCHWTLFY